MKQAGRRALLAMLLAAATTSTSHATRLLFESYVGNRPAEAARLMPLIRTIFERHQYTVDPLVLAMTFREHAYRPGLVNPSFAELLKRSERRSEEAFWNENYLKAIDDLGNLIIGMRQNPLIFTREPKYRELALRVLIFHALACGRQARLLADKPAEAAKFERMRDDTLAEVLRSYPSKVFTTKDFGDEGAKLLSQARDHINQSGRGRISITTSDPEAQIYINEIVQGTAKAEVGDFVPGVYRILIIAPSGEARQYELEVTANQTSRLSVDWSVDSLLVLDNNWAGFKYPGEKEHALEATLVHELAQANTSAVIATTVTVAATHGRLSVTGTSYNTLSGQIFRSGRVELTGSPANDILLNRLADCMLTRDSACGEGILPVTHPEFTPPSIAPKHEAPVIAEVDQVLPVTDATAEAAPPAQSWPRWLVAGGTTALAAGVALYALEDEPAYRDTGLALGALGLAALGVGAWCWIRGDRVASVPTSVPTVSLTASGAMIGWSGGF